MTFFQGWPHDWSPGPSAVNPFEPIPILFEYGGAIYASANTVMHYFPALIHQVEQLGYVDAQVLGEQLFPVLRGSFRIPMKAIRSTLRSLFGLLQPKFGGQGVVRKTIKVLHTLLNQDLNVPLRTGLSRSRYRFLILAFVAQATQSHKIASSLVSFFYANTHNIMAYEPFELLQEWGAGIVELRGLITEQDFQDCMYHLARKGHKMISAYRSSGLRDPRIDTLINLIIEVLERDSLFDYDRGRRPHRQVLYETRASTVPVPRIHRHHHISRARTPHFLSPPDPMMAHGVGQMMTMAHEPMISPGLVAPVSSPFVATVDDVEVLACRQDLLEDQVRDIQFTLQNGLIT